MTVDLKDLFPGLSTLDSKSSLALLSALKKNFKGQTFDYLKFKQSVVSLNKMDMAEETSYKSAFTTAQTMGLTKEGLLKSAENYFYVLEQEMEKFSEALLAQRNTKIDGRRAEVEELQQKIKNHKQRIVDLEKEIELFQNRIDTVDQDVELANTKIQGTKEKFLSVYKVISKDIKEDISNIKNHI